MLVACRLASLSALEGHYAGVKGRAQCGAGALRLASNALVPPRLGGPRSRGLSQRLLRSRRRVRRIALRGVPPAPSMSAAEKETGNEGASGKPWGCSERALTPADNARKYPFEHVRSGAPRYDGWHTTRACVVQAKSLQYAPFMGMTRVAIAASPRARARKPRQ